MRYPLAVALIVVAIIGASPLIVGNKIEQAVGSQLERFNEIPGYQFSLESYDQGYLSSSATVRIEFDRESLGLAELDDALWNQLPAVFRDGLILRWQIGNGPLLHQQGLGFGFMEATTSIDASEYSPLTNFLAQANIEYLLRGYTRLGFRGRGWLDLDMPPINTTLNLAELPVTIGFGGAEGHYELEQFGKISQGSNHLDQLRLVTGFSVFEIQNMTLSSEMDIWGNLLLADQNLNLNIGTISYSMPGVDFSLDDLAVHLQIAEGESPANRRINEEFSFGRAQTSDWRLEDAAFAMELGNISNQLILDYYQFSARTPSANNDPEQDNAENNALVEFLAPRLAEALYHDPWMQISKLGFSWQGQQLEGSLSLSFEQPQLLSANPSPSEMVFWGRQSLILDLLLQADKPLVESLAQLQVRSRLLSFIANDPDNAPRVEDVEALSILQAREILDGLIASGYLLENQRGFLLGVKLRQGSLDINGIAMPIPLL